MLHTRRSFLSHRDRSHFYFLSLLIVLSLTFFLASTAFSATTLRMQTFYGAEMDDFMKEFQTNIKSRTNGAVNIQLFHGGEIVGTDGLFSAVEKGILDIAHGTPIYWDDKIDIARFEFGLPGEWSSKDEAQSTIAAFKPLLDEAYSEKGISILAHGYGSYYDLLTKKPVHSLDDLRSMKIRTTGVVAELLNSLGITTQFVPAEEIYIALSTNLIDGIVYGGPSDYEQMKFNEVAKYYTFLGLQYPGWIESVIINDGTYNKLDANTQDILKEESQNLMNNIQSFIANRDQQILDNDDVFEFQELSKDDKAAVAEAAHSILEKESQRSDRTRKAFELLKH